MIISLIANYTPMIIFTIGCISTVKIVEMVLENKNNNNKY